ncbi:MAG TPA: SRPBCC family protein [Mycobacteriales bacterium]|jgi:carbon monoxide dehydrogenase subunit G|nr:SRPBCC family protein [Mycobacteriales bacterium]
MQLQHSFTVPVGVEDAWKVLLDVEKIAPCMPGATLGEVNGDEFTGTVKVKLGPIGLTYKGKARFAEKDVAARRAVIEASGKDARGSGTAKATVTTVLSPESERSTRVVVDTDLNITGKPAQFGRGVMADVGNKLIGQFASCLEAKIAAGELETDGAAGPGSPAPAPAPVGAASGAAPDPAAATAPVGTETVPAATPPRSPIRAAEEIDLLATVGMPPAVRYAAVALGGFLVGALVAYLVWGQ